LRERRWRPLEGVSRRAADTVARRAPRTDSTALRSARRAFLGAEKWIAGSPAQHCCEYERHRGRSAAVRTERLINLPWEAQAGASPLDLKRSWGGRLVVASLRGDVAEWQAGARLEKDDLNL
jgi:hypothetical protein